MFLKEQLHNAHAVWSGEKRRHQHYLFEHHLWIFINSVWWLWIYVFPLWLQFRAFEDIWLGLTGTAASSSIQSQITVEGIMDQKEKVKVAASKGKECFQCYMGYLKGTFLPGQLWQSYDLVLAGPAESWTWWSCRSCPTWDMKWFHESQLSLLWRGGKKGFVSLVPS